MSHRLQIVLQDPAAAQLQELAAAAQEPPSTVAAQLVRDGLARASQTARVRPMRASRLSLATARAERPSWLQPYGGDAAWSEQMWGAIVALRGRYARLLEPLKDGWWHDATDTETLCALAVWRAEIDDAGSDPREELAFQAQLAEFSRALREKGGGVSRTWVPGPPPPSWAAP